MLNLARFDLVSIHLIVSCAQTGNLTASARQLHIALAAASRRLRDVEATLGQALFVRRAKGLAVTDAGRVFVRHGLAVLQAMGSLETDLADQRDGTTRHVKLCASTAAINQFLPDLLASYARIAPQVRVDLEEQVSDEVIGALHEGRADLGIFVEGPNTAGLRIDPFRHDVLVLVLPADHALAASLAPLVFADALGEDFIILNAGAAMREKQLQSALGAGRPLRVRMQVRSFDAVCHLVASKLGIAVLPHGAVRPMLRSMKLVARPLADAWAERRLLLGRGDGVPNPDVEALVRHLATPSQNANARGSNPNGLAGRRQPDSVP